MNKDTKKFCEKHNLIMNMQSGYGVVKGYEVCVLNNAYGTSIHFAFFASEIEKQEIFNDVQASNIKGISCKLDAYGCLIVLASAFKIEEKLETVTNFITNTLVAKNIKGAQYCPICGNELVEKVVANVDGYTISIDQTCRENINQQLSVNNQAFDNMPNNYSKGFAGALVGASVGVVITIVLYLIGFISAISAFVSVYTGAELYVRFGGKPTKTMVVIVFLTTFVALILALFIVYYFNYVKYGAGLTYFEFLSAVSEPFIHDLILTIVFIVLGSVYEIAQLSRKVKRTQSI